MLRRKTEKIKYLQIAWFDAGYWFTNYCYFHLSIFWNNKAVYVENPSEDRRRNTNKRLRKRMEKNSQHKHTILNQSLVSVYNALCPRFDQKVFTCINVSMTYQSAWRSVNVLYKLFGTYMYMLVLRYFLIKLYSWSLNFCSWWQKIEWWN